MFPVPFDLNLSRQALQQVTHMPQPILPIWPRPVGLDRPPLSFSEVELRSAVHFYALVNATQIAKKMVPNGIRQHDFWQSRDIVVNLRPRFMFEAYRFMGRGGWVCQNTNVSGENVIELYAFLHNCSYLDAIYAIGREAGVVGENGAILKHHKNRLWIEERHPLSLENISHDASLCPSVQTEIQTYYNQSQHPILRAIRHNSWLSESITTYKTLQRHHKSHQSQWLESLPQAPYPIFNAQLLSFQPNRLIVLVNDEFEAAELTCKYNGFVFIAIPGGLKNFPSSNLELLRERRIRVVISHKDLEVGHRIQRALQTAGVGDAHFVLDHNDTPKPFDSLEAVAKDRGVMLLPPTTSELLPLESVVICAAGERIPGADKIRNILLNPIIREGELVWIYAEPKIGKTWTGLSIAYSISMGKSTIGRWSTKDSSGVLYVDGEMQPDALRHSIDMVMVGAEDRPGPAPFSIICAKNQPDGLVDITSEEWQEKIEKALRGKKLLILDNFQSLTDNGPAAFNLIRQWLCKLTQMGIAVIVLDHTNREGELQGSIAKERVADLVIALRYPDEEAKKEGRILVEFPRARRLHGADEEPFQLKKIFTEEAFKLEVVQPKVIDNIEVKPRIARIALVVFAKDHEGMSYPEIHKKYDIPQSTAHGYYKKVGELSGEDKAALDQELQRLIAVGPQTTSK